MVSQKQLEANRRNALMSTGPKTPEGKAAVSRNALKHGLLSKEVVLDDESGEAFEEFHKELLADLAAEGALECELADRIAAQMWRLRRARRIELEMMEADHGEGLLYGPKHSDAYTTLGRVVAQDMAHRNTYGKFCRYEAHMERGLYRALHELQRLQAARKGEPVSAPAALDVTLNGDPPARIDDR